MLVDKELEEESATCNDREWLTDLVRAKTWLLNRKRAQGLDKLVRILTINDDIERYLKQ